MVLPKCPKKNDILKTATLMFAHKGFRQTSMAELSRSIIPAHFTLWLYKQYGKVEIKASNNNRCHSDSAIFWILLKVNSKDGIYFAILLTLQESRRTSDPVLLRVRSIKLRLHPQTPWLCSPPAFTTIGFTRIISKRVDPKEGFQDYRGPGFKRDA